jgi:hypothetical protein
MNTTKPYAKPYKLLTPAQAEAVAAELQSGDEDWKYVAIHDPKGTGWSFIEVYDEDSEFVGRH